MYIVISPPFLNTHPQEGELSLFAFRFMTLPTLKQKGPDVDHLAIPHVSCSPSDLLTLWSSARHSSGCQGVPAPFDKELLAPSLQIPACSNGVRLCFLRLHLWPPVFQQRAGSPAQALASWPSLTHPKSKKLV